MMPDVQLRDATEADVPIFFLHRLDPASQHMAAFVTKDRTDREAFTAHWTRILANDAIVKKTILVDGEVVGNIMSFEMMGKPSAVSVRLEGLVTSQCAAGA